jgi:hypothetical protein
MRHPHISESCSQRKISSLTFVPFVFPERRRKPTTTVFNGWAKPKLRFDQDCGISG